MTPEDAYDVLHQISFLDPNFTPPKGHSTFLVIRLTEEPGDNFTFSSAIVDPGMPSQGGPQDYLHLQSPQRTALEMAHITQEITQEVSAIAMHGPTSKACLEKARHKVSTLCHLLRYASLKASARKLESLAAESEN